MKQSKMFIIFLNLTLNNKKLIKWEYFSDKFYKYIERPLLNKEMAI
jgi:hypothetical protein